MAATPKPRLVNLEVVPQGQEPFSIGMYTHKAVRYVVKVKIGGVAGAIASLLGKKTVEHSGVGTGRRRSGLNQVGWTFIRRRSCVADGTRDSCCVAGQHQDERCSSTKTRPPLTGDGTQSDVRKTDA